MKTKLVLIVAGILLCSNYLLAQNSNKNEKTLKNVTIDNNKILVYIYRISNLSANEVLPVDCDDTIIGNFAPKNYYICILNPGKHVFSSGCENVDELFLKGEPNQTYYIEIKPKFGINHARCKLLLIDNVRGQKDLSKCEFHGMNKQARIFFNN
ncbi:MAG: hypothetical protein WCK92_08110 [Bacteroidota bacterium]